MATRVQRSVRLPGVILFAVVVLIACAVWAMESDDKDAPYGVASAQAQEGVSAGAPVEQAGSAPSPREVQRPEAASPGRIAQGGSIRGRTVHRDGSPFVGATIQIGKEKGAISGNDGRFALTGLPRGTYCLCAAAEGAVSVPSGPLVVRGSGGIEEVELVMDRACYLSGRVNLGHDTALAEAKVTGVLRLADALPEAPAGAFGDALVLAASTGADGTFRLGPFAPGRVELRVEHDAAIPFARLFRSDAADVMVDLAAASTLTGTVMAVDGAGPAVLEKVRLLVASPNRPGWVVAHEGTPRQADASAGRFVLMVPFPGEVVVSATTRDHGVATSEPVRVVPGKPHAPLRLRAVAGMAVSGRVHDAAGVGVAGAEVHVRDLSTASEAAASTAGADGGFELTLAAGRYLLDIRKSGWSSRQMPLEVTADRPPLPVDASLERGGALRGRILLGEGAAAPALEVRANRTDDPKVQPLVTMVGDGVYTFDCLPPGDYVVRVVERGAPPAGDGEAVHVDRGADAMLDLTPGRGDLCRLRGSVLHGTGPLPFVTVQLARGNNRRLATVVVDRRGEFEFDGLGAGLVTLTVLHGANGPVLERRTVELRAGELVDVALRVDYGSLGGRVVAAEGRLPLGEIRIEVLAADGRVVATTRSAADGSFQLPVVQAGDWSLGVGRLGVATARKKPIRVVSRQALQVGDIEL